MWVLYGFFSFRKSSESYFVTYRIPLIYTYILRSLQVTDAGRKTWCNYRTLFDLDLYFQIAKHCIFEKFPSCSRKADSEMCTYFRVVEIWHFTSEIAILSYELPPRIDLSLHECIEYETWDKLHKLYEQLHSQVQLSKNFQIPVSRKIWVN